MERYLSDFRDKDWVTKKHYAARIESCAEESPEELVDHIPRIQTLIDTEDSNGNKRPFTELLTAVGKVAERYPEEVLPLVPELKACFDDSLETQLYDRAVAASYALGAVAKEYPNVARDSIPRFREAIEIDNKYVRNNGMAMLADLADEYPDELRDYLQTCSEELDADDYMRYNALTVITRVAKKYPDIVEDEVGVDAIERMLEDDHDRTRENACWALQYLGDRAKEAIPRLQELCREDSDERVQEVAEMAYHHIEKRDKDWTV